MSAALYAQGVFSLVVIVGAWSVAGRQTVCAVAPLWPASMRALATTIVALAGVVVASELLGTFGAFRRWHLALASVALGTLLVLAARRMAGAAASPVPAKVVSWAGMSTAARIALVAASVVLAQWGATALHAYDNGITEVDSQTYHLPHAAQFATAHRTTSINYVAADAATPYHPANVEVLHSVGMLTLHTDVASVALNALLLAVALLAAFCVGRAFGVGPVAVVMVSALAMTPLLADRQAASAANDFAALGFFLAAVAFALAYASDDDQHRGVAAVLCGLAAGLALGSKLTMVVPVAGITLTVFWLARRDWRRGAMFVAGLVVSGAYWYLRNLVHTGNPVPSLSLGPFAKTPMKLVDTGGASVSDYLGRGDFWKHTAVDGLHAFFGSAWPVFVAAVVVAIGGSFFSRRDPAPRHGAVVGLAVTVTATLAAYLVTPTTAGGRNGSPALFAVNLRYTLPGVALALVLLPALGALRRRPTAVAACGLAVIAATFLADLDAPVGVVATSAILVGAVLLGSSLSSGVRTASLMVVTAFAIVVGLPVTHTYEANRYADASGPVTELLHWGRAAPPGARVGIVGLPRQYAFRGPRLETTAQYVGRHVGHHEFTDYATCASWRTALRRGRYDFVVAQHLHGFDVPAFRWTRLLPGVTVLVDNSAGAIFALPRRVSVAGC